MDFIWKNFFETIKKLKCNNWSGALFKNWPKDKLKQNLSSGGNYESKNESKNENQKMAGKD